MSCDSARITEWPAMSSLHERELHRIRDRQREQKRLTRADLYRALKERDNG